MVSTQVDLAREAFESFIPRFNGDGELRAAWLSDPQRRQAGAQTIRAMLEQERSAVAALERSFP